MILAQMNIGIIILIVFGVLLGGTGIGVFVFFLMRNILRSYRSKTDVVIENATPKKQMLKGIGRYIKDVGNFGSASLIYIDLDSFHKFYDHYGQKSYAIVVQELARRVMHILPPQALFSKMEMDEFLCFIKDIDDHTKLEKLCSKILDSISKPFILETGEEVRLKASLGRCSYPQAGNNLKDLLLNLETAVYVSKRNGGNQCTNYYATLLDEEKENMELYREVKEAIQNNEFVLYYQPILDLEKQELLGAEALMRWNHPKKGVLSPQNFIDFMEQSGDIHWVGEWGIDQMIRFQQAMEEQFPDTPLTFSLNLSTKQILNPELATNLIRIAAGLNANPTRFMFEITDFMVFERIDVAANNIHKLKAFGFKFAIDGFVLENRTVQAVQNSPVDVIKIGRGFLKNIVNNSSQEQLLVNLLSFCREKNILIVSEGIEGAEVAQYVINHHISYGSGYFFARPLSTDSFKEYINFKEWETRFTSLTRFNYIHKNTTE